MSYVLIMLHSVIHCASLFTASRVEVLELLRAISCEACTLEAGRRWSVALIRQGGHLEYGRLPAYMVGFTSFLLPFYPMSQTRSIWPGNHLALSL